MDTSQQRTSGEGLSSCSLEVWAYVGICCEKCCLKKYTHNMYLGLLGSFELAEKCATVVTLVFPLRFNSGMFVISALDAKCSKLSDLSDFNWRIKLVKFPEGLKCVNINILIILWFLLHNLCFFKCYYHNVRMLQWRYSVTLVGINSPKSSICSQRANQIISKGSRDHSHLHLIGLSRTQAGQRDQRSQLYLWLGILPVCGIARQVQG